MRSKQSSDLWWTMMETKLGMDREGVKRYLSEKAKERWQNPDRKPSPGGQFKDNPELARELGAKGRATRWGKKA